nr:eukaryotic translation initiation factor 4 gamma 1-like isoform X4 [Oncorhynchus nerka]
MITEAIMHDTIVKLLKNHDEDSLECLCTSLSTIGKELARPRMDEYCNQIEKIVKNRTTSPRITSMLQNVMDLRKTEIPQLAEKMEKIRLQTDDDAEDHTGPAHTEPVLRPHYKSSPMKQQELKKCLSQATLEDGERFFTKLIETRCSEVREWIQAKEKEMVSEAEGLIQTLEKELDELKMTETEARQLPHIEDVPHFFQKEDRQRLKEGLEETKAEGQRELLCNIKFMCELFKLKMIMETVMHNCIVKLLKNGDDGSLEVLCTLLFTIGKDLEEDSQEAEPRMDQHYKQIVVIIKKKRTSPRIRYMLCDAMDLRELILEKNKDN